MAKFISNIKSRTAVMLFASILGSATIMPNVYADDGISQQIYRDASFGRIAEHIRTDLRSSGYQVMNIKADDYAGKPALEVYAKKQQNAYELIYSYPDLKLLESKQKLWSQLWEDDNQPDIEDKIKQSVYQDENFESLKQQARQKLTAMGYEVDDIEVDDYKRKAILKVDAEKNSEDYEIKLSYPELDIIKIEED